MPKNYRRGLTRFYVLLSVLWLVWGMYKPVFDRNRALNLSRFNRKKTSIVAKQKMTKTSRTR
jgi:hypothetical protein